MNIAEIRKRYPQYNDLSDQQLADSMHEAHYADMPRAEFDSLIGLRSPGYIKARERAETIAAGPGRTTFKDAIIGPFADEVAGAADFVGQGVENVARRVSGKPVEISAADAYRATADVTRADMQRYGAENPKKAMAGNLLGGLMMGPAGLQRAGLLNAVGTGAKQGAISGGIFGVAEGEGGIERLKTGALSAGLGGTLGGMVPLGVAGTKASVTGVADLSRALTRTAGLTPVTTNRDATARAVDYVRRTLARDEIAPQDAARRLAAGRANNMTLADVGGENTMSALRMAAQSPGKARNQVSDFAKNRQLLQRDRIAAATENVAGDLNTERVAAEIAAERGSDASANFGAALGRGVVRSKPISSLFQSPTMRSAIGYAQKIAGDEYALARANQRLGAADGEDWAKAVGDLPNKTAFPAKYLHYLKMGLDEQLESFRDPITKRINYGSPQVRAADQVRKAFRNEVKRLNPAYAEALDKFSSQSRLITAMRDGEAAISMTENEISTLMRNQTPAERQNFRSGFGRSIRDMVEKTRDRTNAAQQIMGNEAMRKRVTAVFGKDARRYLSTINAENRKFETGAALGGSQTTPRALDEADLSAMNAVNAIKSGARGGVMGVADALISGLARKYDAATMPEEVKQWIATLLTSDHPGLQRAALDAIKSRIASRPRTFTPGGAAGSIGSGLEQRSRQ